MEINIIEVSNFLAWLGGLTGVILLLMLLSSIILGADYDIDIDTDTDGPSMGGIKSLLTFLSISSLTIRAIILHSDWSWTVAILSGVAAGIISVFILIAVFRLLLAQEEDGSWQLWESIGKVGRVYVPIHTETSGKVLVDINDVEREVLAKSKYSENHATGEEVLIVEATDKYVIVTQYKAQSKKETT